MSPEAHAIDWSEEGSADYRYREAWQGDVRVKRVDLTPEIRHANLLESGHASR